MFRRPGITNQYLGVHKGREPNCASRIALFRYFDILKIWIFEYFGYLGYLHILIFGILVNFGYLLYLYIWYILGYLEYVASYGSIL